MLFRLFPAPAPGVAVDQFTRSPMTQIKVPWCTLAAVFCVLRGTSHRHILSWKIIIAQDMWLSIALKKIHMQIFHLDSVQVEGGKDYYVMPCSFIN